MKNNMLFLIPVALILSGCAVLRSPHKDFRGHCVGEHPRFFYSADNRMAICLPGYPADSRKVFLDCNCASGTLSHADYMRWPDPMYEIKWDTVQVSLPCTCDLFYLTWIPQLQKDVQRKISFIHGSVSREYDMEEDFE
ncbi:MAG: hypothetical protein K9M36_02695 [Candidatus Pacebacteria bacterium]|nr:hypothetical protein [Candidatus Paceibacterota bacterium]